MTGKKNRKKKFTAVRAVKAAARQKIGTPPATRLEHAGRPKEEKKHKPTLADLLHEAES
jgi:hypothetical protein